MLDVGRAVRDVADERLVSSAGSAGSPFAFGNGTGQPGERNGDGGEEPHSPHRPFKKTNSSGGSGSSEEMVPLYPLCTIRADRAEYEELLISVGTPAEREAYTP